MRGTGLAAYSWSTGGAGYDNEDRLTNWSRTSGDTQTWNLSLVGDWSSTAVNGTTQTRTHTMTHELTAINGTPLAYDVKGNLTTRNDSRTFAWDFDNRLKTTTLSGVAATYTYDALGRRVTKTAGGATTVFVSCTRPIQHSPWAGQEIVEYTLGAAAASPQRRYVYGTYIDEPLMLLKGSNKYYYHANSLYCIATLTNNAGAVYELYGYNAYGQTRILAPDGVTSRSVSNAGNDFAFCGRRLDDETGLIYFRARYFEPLEGRFISRDPAKDILSSNLYCYSDNGPTNLLDPSGFCPERCDDPCGDIKKGGEDRGHIGGVVCCGGKLYTCIWKSGGHKRPSNPQAISIIDGCTKKHEDHHLNDQSMPTCDKDRPGPYRRQFKDEKQKNFKEAGATLIQQKCLEDNLKDCKGEPNCEADVKNEKAEVDKQAKDYSKKAGI